MTDRLSRYIPAERTLWIIDRWLLAVTWHEIRYLEVACSTGYTFYRS